MLIIKDIAVVEKEFLCALIVREVTELTIRRHVHGISQDIDYALGNLQILYDKVNNAKPEP